MASRVREGRGRGGIGKQSEEGRKGRGRGEKEGGSEEVYKFELAMLLVYHMMQLADHIPSGAAAVNQEPSTSLHSP